MIPKDADSACEIIAVARSAAGTLQGIAGDADRPNAISHQWHFSGGMDDMTSADMVGYAATVVGTSMMLPQLARSWRTQQMRDVAFGMIALFLLKCILF